MSSQKLFIYNFKLTKLLTLKKKCMVAVGFEPAISLVTAFQAACTPIELLAALHSSFEKLVLLAALGRERFAHAQH